MKVTVDVKKAGRYRMSSTFAADPAMISFDVAFNGVDKGTYVLPGTSNVHVWRRFDDIGTIELDAGLQVLQFTAKVLHLQEDYLEFTAVDPLSDGGAPADANAGGGASGAAGAGPDGARDSGSGTGAPGASGTAGTAGGASGLVDAATSPPGAGGAGGAPLGAAGAGGTPSGPGSGGAKVSSGRGCAISGERETSWLSLVAVALFALRRRRARR